MKDWFQVSVVLSADLSDLVSSIFFDLGSAGLQVEDGVDRAEVRLTAYFSDGDNRDSLVFQVRRGLEDLIITNPEYTECLRALRIELDVVPQTDWTTAWQEHFHPVFPTDRIVVCPPWNRVPSPPGGFAIVIEPKTAFGTGHHETTRLALQQLEVTVEPGDRVLDVGTGSGILSIAAVLLDAGEVVGVDPDPLAVENAHENAALNGVEGRLLLLEGSVVLADGLFDVVVANIISSILTPLLPELKRKLKASGRLILGGVLAREEEGFRSVVEAAGLRVQKVVYEGEWICFCCVS
ncbi:MAG: 50S ribosomal protein L11 methyltransferase [bacterium]|nr:50S ribosomal protein L11 methyltransferase [bacterium]